MKTDKFFQFIIGFVGTFLANGGIQPAFSQTIVTETFQFSGPCCSCGKPRIDSILKTMTGLKSSVWYPQDHKLAVTFDKQKTSVMTIQLDLSVKGYNAGDFDYTPNMGMSSCCGRAELPPKIIVITKTADDEGWVDPDDDLDENLLPREGDPDEDDLLQDDELDVPDDEDVDIDVDTDVDLVEEGKDSVVLVKPK